MTGERTLRRRARGRTAILAVPLALALAALTVAPAAGHVERASYWPDPAPDTSVDPPAGGSVPSYRDLFTALDSGQTGETRVVCDGEAVPLPGAAPSREQVNRLERRLRRARGAVRRTRRAVRRSHRRVRRARGAAKQRQRARRNRAKQRRQRARNRARSVRRALGTARARYGQALAAHRAALAAHAQALAANPSMQRLDASIADARANGYVIRPSQPPIPVSEQEAERLRNFNARLLAACAYDSIQAAVNDSGNNDRVVVMPGLYTEPESRAQPRNDPACEDLKETNDRGNTGALSYAYQATCPNDQNLVAVIGREPMNDNVEQPPLDDRHGIPDQGPCIRCNLQIEGSGVGPDDVVVDTGPPDSADRKDVAIRADRADGFVLANLTAEGASEHAVYLLEVNGFLIERTKTNYNHEYGVLTFTSDFGLMQDCEARDNGDAGLYPGSSANTGEGRDTSVHPEFRYSQEIRRCDMHHNALGYSGSNGNAVHVNDNDFYDNALGLSMDVFSSVGHPGFPADSMLIENNRFYSNNFNPYLDPCGEGEEPGPPGPDQGCSDVVPTVPVPVGTGIWFPGANDNIVRDNRIWDNWRRGTMLFSVPDAVICPPDQEASIPGCSPEQVSTSHRNRFHDNVMGQDMDGNAALNGVDFWWDEFLGNAGNCWPDNVGPDGTRGSLTSDPIQNPVAGLSVPGTLPENCATSVGGGLSGTDKEVELVSCFAAFSEGAPTPCTWFDTPPKP